PDGKYFIVSGYSKPGRQGWAVKVFEGPTGKEVWGVSSSSRAPGSDFALDPAGKLLAYRPAEDAPWAVIEMGSGKVRGTLKGHPLALGPGARFWLGRDLSDWRGCLLCRGSDGEVLVRLGMDVRTTCVQSQFSPDGGLVAWG